MVKVSVNGVELYLDGTLQSNLDICKDFVKHKWDMVILITGEEGAGKSTFAAQLALYLDPGFNVDQIVFNPRQFGEAVDKCQPGSCIVYDEADAWSGHWADRIVTALKQSFKRIRSKRLYLILVTPSIFDLSKYLVVHRARFVLNTYAEGFSRGYFSFYGKESKNYLFFNGKKFWNMKVQSPDFRGRFTNLPKGFPVDMGEDSAYQHKKDKATKELLADKKGNNPEQSVLDFKLACVQRADEGNVNDKTLSLIFGVHTRTIRNYRSQLRKNLGISLDRGELEAGKAED